MHPRDDSSKPEQKQTEAATPDDLTEAAIGMTTVVPGPASEGTATPGLSAGAFTGAAVKGNLFNPLAEEKYWSERHSSEPYTAGEPYENYEAAYQAGYEGYSRFGGQRFEDAEAHVRKEYEGHGPRVPWEKARHAARAAWERVHENHPKRS